MDDRETRDFIRKTVAEELKKDEPSPFEVAVGTVAVIAAIGAIVVWVL